MVGSAAAVCETAGAQVEDACPDFGGADECFRTLRAWQFEATLGPFLDEHSALVRASLYENMLQGRTLTGPQVGRAAVLRPALFHRMREFLEFYDALILPVAPVRAFDAGIQYPTWSPGGNSRTISAGWARSVTSPSPAIRRSACRPGSPPPARPLGCSSSDGTAGSATSLACPGFESVTTCASIHPHWADLDGVRSRTGPNPRRLGRVFTRAGPYATRCWAIRDQRP